MKNGICAFIIVPGELLMMLRERYVRLCLSTSTYPITVEWFQQTFPSHRQLRLYLLLLFDYIMFTQVTLKTLSKQNSA